MADDSNSEAVLDEPKVSEETKEPLENSLPKSQNKTPQKPVSKMSPFFNREDEPFELSEEEESLLLLPTESMFVKLFNTCNSYLATSRYLGKMYAHISWCNKDFSKVYLKLLGQFVQKADYNEIRKKYKTPLMQVLMLNDTDSLVEMRAIIAMKYLFSQMFVNIKDKYYVLSLEVLQLIFHLAYSIKSIHVLIKKHKELLYPKMLDFLERDPLNSMEHMQWIPSVPRDPTTLNLHRRLLTSSIEDMLQLNIMDKRNKLNELFDLSNELEYMPIKETMLSLIYKSGDELYFFSDKYKDWIHSFVIQPVSSDVVFIECELSSKERNTPIFVFKEVLESLDKELFGESIQEIESNAYFHRLFNLTY